jgi:haloalkane dehalogenase
MQLSPFAHHHLRLGGLRYHYVDEGEGRPVVMVHGNPTWSFYYRRLISALRGDFRTIVPDHIGCGLSDKPNDSGYSYTLKSRVDDLEALLNHLGVREDITLIVHDWGGMIGMAYASRYPERIARLVVFNTAAFHLPANKKLPWTLRACRNPLLGAPLVRGLGAFHRAAARLCPTRRPLTQDVREAYTAPYDSWNHRIAVLRFVQDIPIKPRDQAYDIVSEVQGGLGRFAATPMLICWGQKDFVFDDDFLREWTRHFPKADVHRFPDAGHYVLEDAHEEIVPLVKSFLSSARE